MMKPDSMKNFHETMHHLANYGQISLKTMADGIAGMDNPTGWMIRRLLLRQNAGTEYIARALAGVDTARAWRWRKILHNKYRIAPTPLLRSLAGIGGRDAMMVRKQLIDDPVCHDVLAKSMTGIACTESWSMRHHLLARSPQAMHGLHISLAGIDDAQAWAIRDHALMTGHDITGLCLSLSGLSDHRAMSMRSAILENHGHDHDIVNYLAHGLVMLDLPGYRSMLINDYRASLSWVCLGLAGVMTPEAIHLRQRPSLSADDIFLSLNGDYLTAGTRRIIHHHDIRGRT